MIVDSSALIAIVFDEPSIVVDRLPGSGYSSDFGGLLADLGIIIESVTPEQARIAREAYQRFGKGSGHPAGLNFGDCFAYALAKDLDEPLLFIGKDFVQTDIRTALPHLES